MGVVVCCCGGGLAGRAGETSGPGRWACALACFDSSISRRISSLFLAVSRKDSFGAAALEGSGEADCCIGCCFCGSCGAWVTLGDKVAADDVFRGKGGASSGTGASSAAAGLDVDACSASIIAFKVPLEIASRIRSR